MLFYKNVYSLIIYNVLTQEQFLIKGHKAYGENAVAFSKGLNHEGVFTAIL